MVGTSRESINKPLRSWAAQGLVAVERSRVTVVDTAGLEAIAHFTFD